jgi:predicted kinase
MKKVIITKGLQGCGKTTWAKQMQSDFLGQYKRVNKDDLRALLDNGIWSKGNEKFILKLRDNIILQALQDGKHVIVDDTNLNSTHENHIRELVKGFAEVEIKDFTDVDIETCIKNDAKRANPVGEKIIRQTYKQWLYKEPVKPEYNPLNPFVVIVDMDGTLSLFGNKNPYDRDFQNDELNDVVANIIECRNVILVSGRKEKFRDQTLQFLQKYNIEFMKLFMRKDDDDRKDSIVKKEIYDNEILGKYNVHFVLDDRSQVVHLWRSLGLTCLQVADGDF